MARAGEKTDGKAAENFWRVWRQAQAGQVCPVCLLFGQEFYLQEKLLERMRRVWLGETVSELNYSREDGGRLTAGQTADLANQMPFFTVRRLILVDEPGFIPCAARGGKKDDADEAGREDGAADDGEGRSEGEDKAGGQAAAAGGRGARGGAKGAGKGGADAGERAFLAYLAAPAPEVCLVLRCRQGRPDRRNKLVAAIEKAGGLAEAAPLPPARAVPYLAQLAEAAGKRCANPLLEQIVKGQPAGVGLAGAARELEKAIAYAGEAEELTAAMLREILIPSLEADIFRLVDALARQRRPEALRELRELLARGESPFGILAMITRQIRLIFWAKACQKAGYDRGQTARALGCHPFAADKAAEQSRRYTFPGLEAAMAILQETDLAMKSGRQSGQALEDLVIVLGEGRD